MPDYIERFKELVSDIGYVENAVGERLPIDERRFRQCYKENDPVRELLPKYWFCDSVGNVVSIARDKAVWLIPDTYNERAAYHFLINNDGEFYSKIIRRAALCGIVWGVYRYGKAAEILETEGIFGFGTNSKEKLTVSCHHKDGNKLNDDYNNLEFATNRAHLQTIHRLPLTDNKDSVDRFIQHLTDVATEEEPNKITILSYDDSGNKELIAVDNKEFPDSFKKAVAEKILPAFVMFNIKAIEQKFGEDYFSQSRLIFIAQIQRFLKVQVENGGYRVSIPSKADVEKIESEVY